MEAGLNQDKTLSGIETVFAGVVLDEGSVSTKTKPSQGLKPVGTGNHRKGVRVSTKTKPSQGLKHPHSGVLLCRG